MSHPFILPASVTALAVLALLFAEHQQSRVGIWLTKPIAALGFVLAALAVGATHTQVGMAVLAGLVLSLVGDILLIPKNQGAFLAGIISFLLGHVAFAVAFVIRGFDGVAFALGMLGVGLVTALVGRWLIPKVENKMQAPVGAYMLVITVMVALAIGSVAKLGAPEFLVAAVAFFLSDLSVAMDRFVESKFVNRLWGLPLYFGAQLVFAWSVRVSG